MKLTGNGMNAMMPGKTNSRKKMPAADDRADGLDAQPVRDPHVAGVAGEREPLLGGLRERGAGDARHAPGQPVRERPQRPVDERLLELELLEVLRLHRPELGEAGLDRVHRRVAGEPDDDQEDGAGGDERDDDGEGFHRLDLDVDDAADEHEAHEHREPADEQDDDAGREARDLTPGRRTSAA